MWVLCFEELESIMPKIDSLQSAEFFVQFNMIWYRREFQICFTEMIMASMGHCLQTCPNATPKPCLNATQLGYGCPQIYHLVKNFHEIQIFAIFATHDQNTKIKTTKIWHMNFVWTFELMEIFTRVFCVLVLLILMMTLYHYFKPADDVQSSPTGHLC